MTTGKKSGTPGTSRLHHHFSADVPHSIGLGEHFLDNNCRLQDVLCWLVLPPLVAGQFRIWRRGATPVALAAWAWLDAAAEARLMAGEFHLAPTDWQAGDRPWLIYLIAPYGGAERFALDLRRTVFAGHEVRVMGRAGRRPRLEVWPAHADSKATRTGAQPVRPPGRLVDSPLHP